MWSRNSKKDNLKHDCITYHSQSNDSVNTSDISYDLSNIAGDIQKSDGGKEFSPKIIICPPKVVKVADKDVEVGVKALVSFLKRDKKGHSLNNNTDVFRPKINHTRYSYEINDDERKCDGRKYNEGNHFEDYNDIKSDDKKIFRDRTYREEIKDENNYHRENYSGKNKEEKYRKDKQEYDEYDTDKYDEDLNNDDSEELRRKAFKMYKQYLEQKKGPEKCPAFVYVCPKRSYKDNMRRDQCGYDSSFNIFLIVVFMILFVMMIFTTGFIFVVLKTDWLKDFFQSFAIYLIVPAVIILLVMNYSITCSECAKVLPCNFIYLIISVACMSVITTVVTVLLDTTIVLIVYASTAIVVLFFILIAFSRFDFTKWILYVIGMFLALCSICILIALCKKYMHMHYGPIQIFTIIVSTIINVVILIMVLQIILEGRSMDLDESDYAIGAFLLYTSIIELCMSLIQATGILEDNENN